MNSLVWRFITSALGQAPFEITANQSEDKTQMCVYLCVQLHAEPVSRSCIENGPNGPFSITPVSPGTSDA